MSTDAAGDPQAAPPVLVTRRLPDEALERIAARCDLTLHDSQDAMPRSALLAAIEGKLGAITFFTDRVDDEFLDAAGPQLKVVANYAVGFDNIDVGACTSRGVMATNTPDVLTETTADTAFALMLAAARRIAEGDRFIRAREPWIWGPLMMLGRDVHHATLGIVGFGRIGQALARRGRGFGMRIIYHDVYRPEPEVEAALNAEYRDLDDLLAEADFVSLHTNLTPETRHLINAERLAAMKPTAVLVNASRGPVVDEEALARALHDGQIFAAGLDVFEREPEIHPDLLTCDNAVLIPHLGSASVQTRLDMANLAADNLFAVLDGRRPPTPLNREVWDRRVSR
jgi:glyoxylate reductase